LAFETRQSLRKAFRDKRLSLSSEQQTTSAQGLLKQYQKSALFQGAQNVALYLPFNGEVNTQPLIDYLWSVKRDVFVPILHPFCKGHLLFQAFTHDTKMRENHFGILEPMLDVQGVCPVEKLHVILTPLVAFDLTGNRLGMGGGFYDRTLTGLASLEEKRQPIVVGLAHELQKSAAIPAETWDVRLAYILTASKLYSFS
jgi:5-formyltetrahydrofolate cyclo-ligase